MQTIKVEIDANGQIHPLDPLSFKPMGRALLTILDHPTTRPVEHASARQALAMLASPRFANRPAASSEEVKQRIGALRNGWGNRP